MTVHFTAYDADANHSQALNVRIDLSAALRTNPPPVLPSSGWSESQVRARRLSLIMPTPTLVNGRPT